MIAFPSMLIPAAEKAGMKVPENPDNFKATKFPHFAVFCNLQLGRAMTSWEEHWYNAETIAKIPEEKVKKMTVQDFREAGIAGI
jgi:hypothetical protein